MAGNPLDLLAQSDRQRLESFAQAARIDAGSMGAALIEKGLEALRLTRTGLDGSSVSEIARRAAVASRRAG